MNLKDDLRHNKLAKKTYHKIKDMINGPQNVNVPTISSDKIKFIPNGTKNLILLVPTWDQSSFFGGLSTALNIFNKLANSLNYKRKIFVISGKYNSKYAHKSQGIIPEGKNKNLFFLEEDESLPISKNDIYMCTFWTTEILGLNLLQKQEEHFSLTDRLLLYLIQDFEPGFYPWSSDYYLADSTYKIHHDKILAIFNSKLLYEYFKINNYRFAHEVFFEPKLNDKLKQYLYDKQKREKQILLYGRPNTPRNAFSLIESALDIWSKQYSKSTEWKIVSLGESFSSIPLTNNKIISYGKVSLERYAQEMLKSYAGISLMVSPHPSYPPLEMSTFGVKTITNTFLNKDLAGFNKNIISLRNATPDQVANKLIEICKNYKVDNSQVSINRNYVEGNSFDSALNEVKRIILNNVD